MKDKQTQKEKRDECARRVDGSLVEAASKSNNNATPAVLQESCASRRKIAHSRNARSRGS